MVHGRPRELQNRELSFWSFLSNENAFGLTAIIVVPREEKFSWK
jgi:hypothetical protein